MFGLAIVIAMHMESKEYKLCCEFYAQIYLDILGSFQIGYCKNQPLCIRAS